jgi:hypothetical protein
MGSPAPVVGADTRTRRSSPCAGGGRTIGLTETIGTSLRITGQVSRLGERGAMSPDRAKRTDARRNERADLIVAVYRHQVEALAAAGPTLLATGPTPHAALARWIDAFVDFVITKQGLARVLQSADPCFDPLHTSFVQRLVPVCGRHEELRLRRAPPGRTPDRGSPPTVRTFR